MPKPLFCPVELLQTDLAGKTYLITGANSGIGLATTGQLVSQGATVLACCRDPKRSESAFSRLRAAGGRGFVEVLELDLADLASVRRCAATVLERVAHLDGLVNNAGVMNTPKGKTRDGFETQFGTNHLGPFLLTELLLPLLERSAPSRIVNVSSCYHDKAMGREGAIDFDDPNFERRPYDGWAAYAQSKLANLLYARDLAERFSSKGVLAASVHPGWVRTGLIAPTMPLWVQNRILRPFGRWMGMLEPDQGMQSSLYALLSPEVAKHPGAYFSQTGWYRDRSLNVGGWPLRSPNPNAHGAESPRRLREISERLVGLV